MKAFKFNLSGKTAFFKIPEVNTYLYYSYGHIPRVALLGLLGAIMGYKGYSDDTREGYPEFYKELEGINLAVVPKTDKGVFKKKLQAFNNSTAMASQEEGGNLIVKQTWLEDVSWDIYILLDTEKAKELARQIYENKAVYIPYLGSNDHQATISKQEYVEVELSEDTKEINSLYKAVDIDINLKQKNFKYEEALPYLLEKGTERHINERFAFTDGEIKNTNKEIYKDANVKLVFYNGK